VRIAKIAFFCAGSIVALTVCATAQSSVTVTIPSEPLKQALDDYIRQSGVQLIYNVDDVAGVTSRAVQAGASEAALSQILDGTGLVASRDTSGAIIVTRATAGGSDSMVAESVVVTGSRIRNASEPSTPVISLVTEQLLATTPGGIPEALDKMPIFMAASGRRGSQWKGSSPTDRSLPSGP